MINVNSFKLTDAGNILLHSRTPGNEYRDIATIDGNTPFDYSKIKYRVRDRWGYDSYRQLFLAKDVKALKLEGSVRDVFGIFMRTKSMLKRLSDDEKIKVIEQVISKLPDAWADDAYVPPLIFTIKNVTFEIPNIPATVQELGVTDEILDTLGHKLQEKFQTEARMLLLEAVDEKFQEEQRKIEESKNKLLEILNATKEKA